MSVEAPKPDMTAPMGLATPTRQYPTPSRNLGDPIGIATSRTAEAFWTPKVKSRHPFMDLIPDLSDAEIAAKVAKLSRGSQVRVHVANGLLKGENFRHYDNEFRPKTLPEQIMAWRAGRKLAKIGIRSLRTNKIEDYYGKWQRGAPEPDEGANFREHYNNLSHQERRRVRKDEKRYERVENQKRRLRDGRTIPLIGKKVMGFEQIVNTPETRKLRPQKPRS